MRLFREISKLWRYYVSALPYRQLRKLAAGIALYCLGALPYRQLRKMAAHWDGDTLCALPYRQLRKESAWSNSLITTCTAVQAA